MVSHQLILSAIKFDRASEIDFILREIMDPSMKFDFSSDMSSLTNLLSSQGVTDFFKEKKYNVIKSNRVFAYLDSFAKFLILIKTKDFKNIYKDQILVHKYYSRLGLLKEIIYGMLQLT